jgi:hypothetical protein
MADLADRIRIRVLPALLTAFGVAGLAFGLLSLTAPVAADPLPSPSPSAVVSGEPTGTSLVTFPPLPSDAAPSTGPTPLADRVATRVRVAALKIDLPVMLQPNPKKVPCDVAMYLPFGQPGQGLATYLYAHSREGMFLPLLDASKVRNGKSMLGMVVEVWTSDDRRFLYEITEVRRHVPASPGAGGLDDAIAARTEQLWLQASEGPGVPEGQPRNPLLQIVAQPISEETADPADAHPEAKPLVCT